MLKAEAEWCPSTFSTAYRDTRITLGGKGCIDLQLVCDHSRGPVHSSCAPVVDNPAWRLVWALESMKGEDGQIAIDGFYDGVKGPEPGDRELLEKLAATGEEEKMKKQWGVKGFMRGLHGADLLQAYMFEPTLTINGLQSGYVGPPHTQLTRPGRRRTWISASSPAWTLTTSGIKSKPISRSMASPTLRSILTGGRRMPTGAQRTRG